MVKVFPSSFSFIEKQQLLTSVLSEPVAIACSDEFLFVAEENCLLEVFSLETLKLLGQFRTVSLVYQLDYNAKGDCVVTLEKKTASSQGYARIYFKWRGASVDRPMRISLLSSLSEGLMPPQDHSSAEIIELPSELNSPVTCLACCAESGRIAIGMDTTLRIFTLSTEYRSVRGGVSSDEGSGAVSSEHSHSSCSRSPNVSHSIAILLDIQTSMSLCKLSIFSDYVAFVSPHEARVLKLSLLGDSDLQNGPPPSIIPSTDWPPTISPAVHAWLASSPGKASPEDKTIPEDRNFVKWSPSRVWEEEKAAGSLPGSTSSSLVDVSLPVLDSRSHDSRGPSPIVGTLSLPSICNSTLSKVADRHAIEVLGPVEYVRGQPISVRIEDTGSSDTPAKCRVLTMLYRRFLPMKSAINEGEGLQRSATLPSKGRALSHQEDIGLHTVQLLPMITASASGARQLIGISCFLANKFHGYLYDVHVQGHLASSFSFMSPTHAVVCDTTFLHALSAKSVETYTCRTLQTAILHMPNDPSLAEWLQKPCPPPTMDLTLVSANQFVSSSCLASMQDHMVILTKSTEHAQSAAAAAAKSKFLASFSSTGKKVTEPTWNIYVLQKKDAVSMHQQFDELSSSIKDSSPPMYHHLLCEGHNLLRSQLVLNSSLSSQHYGTLEGSLRDNCLALAESLCQYSTEKTAQVSAAHYLVLSRQQIWDIIKFIFNKFPRKPSPPYTILLKFLELVMFNTKLADHSLEEAAKADTVLDLYAEFSPHSLSRLLLQSWLREHFSTTRALKVLESYLKDNTISAKQLFLGKLCQVFLHVHSDQQKEAAKILKEVKDSFLSEWLEQNLNYLLKDNSRMSKLGELMLRTKENSLLDVLFNSISSGQLALESCCQLLQAEGVVSKEQLAANIHLKHFLDGIVLDKVKGLAPANTEYALILLVDVLLARLTVETLPPSSSTPFTLYGARHKWLDSLPPFDSSFPKPSHVVLQDLMQLQALLCSPHITAQGSLRVVQHLEDSISEGMIGELSLKLLSWPRTGKAEQAIQVLFQTRPAITVEYCITFLPSQLSHWKSLLNLLLNSCISTECSPPPTSNEQSPPPTDHTYQSLYRAALNHVVGLCSPNEFLTLLPPTGSLPFFLPFIERSCKLHISKELSQHLHTH